MGSIAARKADQIVRNLESVLAIEYLCAAQGLDFHHPLNPGTALQPVQEVLRTVVPHLDEDRVLHHDLNAARELVSNGTVLTLAEQALGQALG